MDATAPPEPATPDKLWRIEHYGPGPAAAIVRAPTSSAAIAIFRHHLEGYEGCHPSTSSQHVALLEEVEPGLVCVILRPF